MAPHSVLMFTAPSAIKYSPDTKAKALAAASSGTVITPVPSSTPILPSSTRVNWNPAVKFSLFVVGAFVCLVLFFFVLAIIRKFRHQFEAEQRSREIEDRRREAALQWQRLEMERRAEGATSLEVQTHQRVTRYEEQVEEAEFEHIRNVPLAANEYAQTKERVGFRAEDGFVPSKAGKARGQQNEAEGGNDARKSNEATRGDKESFETEPPSMSWDSFQTELGENSPNPLSSDEILRVVNALGYEAISDSQRAEAREKALKDLEGR